MDDGVEVLTDIAYVNYQDRELFLDIYRPSNPGDEKLPTIIVIRGGGWAKGDKESIGFMAAALALRGFATICFGQQEFVHLSSAKNHAKPPQHIWSFLF